MSHIFIQHVVTVSVSCISQQIKHTIVYNVYHSLHIITCNHVNCSKIPRYRSALFSVLFHMLRSLSRFCSGTRSFTNKIRTQNRKKIKKEILCVIGANVWRSQYTRQFIFSRSLCVFGLSSFGLFNVSVFLLCFGWSAGSISCARRRRAKSQCALLLHFFFVERTVRITARARRV